MKYIEGDLIKLAKKGNFDIIAHGCNCFCTMGAGIAKQIKEQIPEAFEKDRFTLAGDIDKLGNYTGAWVYNDLKKAFGVLNCYTQYHYDAHAKAFDYEAFTLCMRKINHQFHGKRIGLPLIGAGLAGGDWNIIEKIIEKELKDMDVTIARFKYSNL
jgi:O-acetyl-ADP-ribose deacetylase (regulator of RNase III)